LARPERAAGPLRVAVRRLGSGPLTSAARGQRPKVRYRRRNCSTTYPTDGIGPDEARCWHEQRHDGGSEPRRQAGGEAANAMRTRRKAPRVPADRRCPAPSAEVDT
jgi:hypothetical protein